MNMALWHKNKICEGNLARVSDALVCVVMEWRGMVLD